MRTSIVLDDKLVAEAFRYTSVKTKRELVDLALREFVSNRRRRDVQELLGSVKICPDYDTNTFATRGGVYVAAGIHGLYWIPVNGHDHIMVPTVNSLILQQKLPDAGLILFPGSGHGAHFQFEFAEAAAHFLAAA